MNINYEFETIAAIATPPGTGGVGIVRVSGEKAFEIVQKIFQGKTFEAGKICHGWIAENDKKVDEVVVLPFKNPHSYTGEDVVEIQGHGGLKVVNKILELVLKNGARMAQKGEFTKRAFLNHKMDLSQAEAVLDLIHAKTDNFAQKSANNLSGALTVETNRIKQNIFDLMSKIIAAVDFPDDVEEPSYGYLKEQISDNICKIEKTLAFLAGKESFNAVFIFLILAHFSSFYRCVIFYFLLQSLFACARSGIRHTSVARFGIPKPSNPISHCGPRLSTSRRESPCASFCTDLLLPHCSGIRG